MTLEAVDTLRVIFASHSENQGVKKFFGLGVKATIYWFVSYYLAAS